MTLEFPDDFDASARNRLARALAEGELGCYKPISLVLSVFEVFIDELLYAAGERPTRTAASIQADSMAFLDRLTKTVYWEYPHSVRLADKIGPSGSRLQQWSFVSWNDPRGFKAEAYEEIRKREFWKDLQQCIVNLAKTAETIDEVKRAETSAESPAGSMSPPESRATPQALLEAYRAAFPDVKTAWIYRAANVHSPDFYRWRQGRVPANSPLARRLESFLKAMQPPPDNTRRQESTR